VTHGAWRRATRCLLAAAALLVPLTGCETGEDQRSATTEVLLAGAGFQIKIADTPERQNQLDAVPQRQIIRYETDGEILYVYANARTCDCLYAGTQANYERYRTLAGSSRARGAQSLEAIEAQPGTNPDWEIW